MVAWPLGRSSGDIAQLGERGVRNAEVAGSSPAISTTFIIRVRMRVGIRFGFRCAPVAQWTERRRPKSRGGGSSPSRGTIPAGFGSVSYSRIPVPRLQKTAASALRRMLPCLCFPLPGLPGRPASLGVGWRRGRDSNPREAVNPYAISSRAHSSTLAPLRWGAARWTAALALRQATHNASRLCACPIIIAHFRRWQRR